jgi:hypothetical protein
MSTLSIRERLVGCWRLVGYSETTDGGEATHPLGDHPLGTILYTPDGYMSVQLVKPAPYPEGQQPTAYAIAYSGPFEVNEQTRTVAHQVQISVIPSWVGTTQIRQVQFPEPDTLVLSGSGRRPLQHSAGDGLLTTATVTWSRQLPR